MVKKYILLSMMRILKFGDYLKKIRGKVSQKDFASIIGISQNHLSYLENGKREPTISLLLLLAEKKGVDISYWFTPDFVKKMGKKESPPR